AWPKLQPGRKRECFRPGPPASPEIAVRGWGRTQRAVRGVGALASRIDNPAKGTGGRLKSSLSAAPKKKSGPPHGAARTLLLRSCSCADKATRALLKRPLRPFALT